MISTESYRLAIWDDDALVSFATRIADAGHRLGVTVERLSRVECERLLRAGVVDAALVPAVNVLSDTELFDVYPAVAISAWRAPHASIHLHEGLGEAPRSVSCRSGIEQEKLMTRIVLREHYGMQPEIDEVEAGTEPDATADGVLTVREIREEAGVGSQSADERSGVILDLGQEWFELTNYPMVWALFASRRGEAESRMLAALVEAVTDEQDPADDRMSVPELLTDTRLRFRLDDVATASLTELADLLFFYGVTEEVPIVHFAAEPASDEEEEDDGLLPGQEGLA